MCRGAAAHLPRLLLTLECGALGTAIATVTVLGARMREAAEPARRPAAAELSPKARRRPTAKRKHEHEGRLLESLVLVVVVVIVVVLVVVVVVRSSSPARLLRRLDPGERILDPLEALSGVG
jgi:hypothetical protein